MTALTGMTDFAKKQPWLVALVAFVLGLIIGLPVLGWGPLAVTWTDASFADLHPDFQKEYVLLVASAYVADLDPDKAVERIGRLGSDGNQILADMAAAAQEKNPQSTETILLGQLKAVVEAKTGSATAPPSGAAPSSAQPQSQPSLLSRFALPLAACLVVILVGAVGGFLYLRTLGKPRAARPSPAKPAGGRATAPPGEAAPVATPTGAPPVARFMTTYTLGDDVYDDSFSVDGPDGSFLGECGMGISETIGVGDPKKVTAFEVWLFDKNDIRTVTKVLMSEHAFRDEGLKSRLAAKGEPVQAVPGDTVMLETATLIVTARVVDMAYGGGALPTNSFFERLTIELAAFKKQAASQ
jgi:hypothetical protein